MQCFTTYLVTAWRTGKTFSSICVSSCLKIYGSTSAIAKNVLLTSKWVSQEETKTLCTSVLGIFPCFTRRPPPPPLIYSTILVHWSAEYCRLMEENVEKVSEKTELNDPMTFQWHVIIRWWEISLQSERVLEISLMCFYDTVLFCI